MDPVLWSSTLLCLLLHLLLRRVLLLRRRGGLAPLPPGPYGVPVLGALPLIGAAPHSALARLARRHGPIMYLKMGTCGAVVASSPSAARAFLKTADAQFANRPAVASARDITYGFHNMVFANYGPRWKLMRKLASLHLLGARALADWSHVRRDEARRMVGAMRERSAAGQAVVVPDAVVCALANMVGQITLSRRVFDAQGAASNAYKDMIVELLTGAGLFSVGDFVPAVAWMDLQDLFTAGTDTSSIIIEWALAEMLKAPAILARAQSELDRVVGHDRRLEESDIPNLPYLQAVCKEALRLHPSTPLGLPHFTFEDCEVAGFRIPKNSRLLVNIWAIGRDPSVWPDPLEFRPERFLHGDAAKIDPLGNYFELIPFGAGRRICAGKLAGMVFVHYFLGTLLHAFDWRLPDGEELINMDETFGLALPKAVPLKAMVRPRLSPPAYE
ncbi:Flavonoid 3',5'-hydroxylase [Ananas comosus]|uniref:Flavonoid 3',5'-hydroxylase n=1 Tax=Ananas comosus TaxID=4615 RepID=A0A199W1J7_ANACO|nr:Flavonoid 3',5'-hydroxylase [Ananas comosus]